MDNDGIFLLLGSNQGDAAANLKEARIRIGREAGGIVATSSVYKTAPWGLENQPDFYNQVLEIHSEHGAQHLLNVLLEIERSMGRTRREKWGPRIIDIDILFYAGQVWNTPRLVIPHPGLPSRRFALVPMAELAPALIHPVLKKDIATLLSESTDSLSVEKTQGGANPPLDL